MTAINIINRFRFAIASFIAPFPITRIVDFPVRFSESGIWESEMYGDEEDENDDEVDWDNMSCCQACHSGRVYDFGNCPNCKTGIYAESDADLQSIVVNGVEYILACQPYVDESNEFHCFAESGNREYFIVWNCVDGQSEPQDWNSPRLVLLLAT